MRPPSSYFKVKDEEDSVRRGDGADLMRPLWAWLSHVRGPIFFGGSAACIVLRDRAQGSGLFSSLTGAAVEAGRWCRVFGL